MKKEILLTNVDDIGNLIWKFFFSAGYSYFPEEIISTKSGDFLITGSVDNNGVLLKIDQNGNLMFEKTF